MEISVAGPWSTDGGDGGGEVQPVSGGQEQDRTDDGLV
jgi:hypothetical protein